MCVRGLEIDFCDASLADRRPRVQLVTMCTRGSYRIFGSLALLFNKCGPVCLVREESLNRDMSKGERNRSP